MQIRTTIKDKTSTCSCLLDFQEFYFIFFFYLFLPFLLTADIFCGYLPLRNSKHVKQIHTDKGPELRNGLAKIIKNVESSTQIKPELKIFHVYNVECIYYFVYKTLLSFHTHKVIQ